MTGETLEAARCYFDNLAGQWDSQSPLDPERQDRLSRALDAVGIRQGDTVLDAGCGTGVLYPLLAERIGRKGRVIGVDFSEGMLQQAREKYGADRRFRWERGEIPSHLAGFRQEAVDRIVCFSAFPHFPGPSRVLGSFFRILRPGGSMAVIHLQGSEALNRFHAGLGQVVADHLLASAPELALLARQCGFITPHVRDQERLYLVVGNRPR